ncbi:MAG: cobalt ECF transporter T component CbiQ [Tissierellia bacterium]|nr:cobalt ECF transporter T component CbiQ [Tissierellia bacterium]
MLLIDKYAYTNRLANFNPMAKFIFAIVSLLIGTIIDNPYINLSIFIIMFILIVFVARIPLNKYIRIISIPIIFLLLSIIPILLSISNANIFIWSVKISNKYMGFTTQGLKESIKIILRVLASINSTFFLALTTPLNNLIKVFKKLKFPDVLIELLVLVYRFIFIFLEEAQEIIMAQEMKFGYINAKNTYKSMALLIKSLFIRVIVRYEDMVIALDTKLYMGEFKTGD